MNFFPTIKINSKQLYLIALGVQSHFDILRQNLNHFKSQKTCWIYDKAKLDIAYHLVKNQNQNYKLTYITRQNFELVELKLKKSQKMTQYSDKIRNLIENYNFVIKNCFSDIHPCEAYLMLNRYMNSQLDKQIVQFFKLTYSYHDLSLKGSFLPELIRIRKQYLNDSGLKLRVLERKKIASESEIKKNINIWQQFYQIKDLKENVKHKMNSNEWREKIDWMTQNKYGWQVSKEDLLQNFGKKYSYGCIA